MGGKMLFLLDADVLIDANRDYYPLERVPEFWEWLFYQGAQGNVKIPDEIYEEITIGNDVLAVWAKRKETKIALLLDEVVETSLVQRVLREGYADDLSDTEVAQIGRDPFLIAYALNIAKGNNRCIVTTESSKPSRKRANRNIPDVCGTFDIPCCHSFECFKTLGFSTGWKALLSI